MTTLWGVVTGNSTLPVASGNTFYDHLNNQAGGVGGGDPVLIPTIHELSVSTLDDTPLKIVIPEDTLTTVATDTGSTVAKASTKLSIEVTDSEMEIRKC